MTLLIVWDESFSIDVPGVDEQHRALADRINALAAAVAEAGPVLSDDRAIEALEALYADTRDHFLHEEAMMEAIGFAGFAGHQREHTMLRAELRLLITDIGRGRAQLDVATLASLKRWLIAHVVSADRVFAAAYAAASDRSPAVK